MVSEPGVPMAQGSNVNLVVGSEEDGEDWNDWDDGDDGISP